MREQVLADGATALDLRLSEQQLSALMSYLDLIERDRERLDLTAIRDPDVLTRRHVLESLALLCAMEEAGRLAQEARLVDIGSGAGVPGLPIAIMRPDLHVTLVESSTTKAAWLAGTCDALQLPLEVLPRRAEDLGRDLAYRETFDVATAKAVAPLAILLELAMPLLKVAGALLAPKGSQLEQEIVDAEPILEAVGAGRPVVANLPGAMGGLRVVHVEKEAATKPGYPRRIAAIRRALKRK